MTAILVILTILVAVGIDAILMAVRRHRVPVRTGVALQAMLEPRPPQGIFLDSTHAWLRITTDGTLRVGVDDFLTEALGEVEAVNPAPRGAQVKRGDPLIRLTVSGREVTIPAPAAGEVVSVNSAAMKEPWSVSRDPYGVGWVVGLWTRDHHEAIRNLRIGSAAGAFLRQEMQRLADFLGHVHAPATAPVLADGGLPGKGAVASLDDSRFQAFQTEFLGVSKES